MFGSFDHYWDDFEGLLTTVVTGPGQPGLSRMRWSMGGGLGNAGTYPGLDGVASHPGIYRMHVSSEDDAHGYLWLGDPSNPAFGVFQLNDVQAFRVVARVADLNGQQLADVRYGFGLMQDASDVASNTPNLGGNGVIVFYSSTSGNWVGRRETASSAQNTSGSHAAALDQWIEARVARLDPTDATTWDVRINGVSLGNLTGAPSNAMVTFGFYIDPTANGNDKQLQIDRFDLIAGGPRF